MFEDPVEISVVFPLVPIPHSVGFHCTNSEWIWHRDNLLVPHRVVDVVLKVKKGRFDPVNNEGKLSFGLDIDSVDYMIFLDESPNLVVIKEVVTK